MVHKPLTLIPGFHLDRLQPQTLTRIAQLLAHHGVEELTFTPSGGLRVSPTTPERLAALAGDLQPLSAPAPPSWINSLLVCPGRGSCRHGLGNGDELAHRISLLVLDAPPPAKVKIGIAGCSRCCTSPLVRDVGLIAGQHGWRLTFGGNSGARPRIGDNIGQGLSCAKAVVLLVGCLTVYTRFAQPKMRSARFLESFGPKRFLHEVEMLSADLREFGG